MDAAIKESAGLLEIPAGFLRPDSEVQEIREARAELQAQQIALQQAQQEADIQQKGGAVGAG
jgi:hypothetical protein